MFQQGRVIIVWLSWLIGGICGVFILLIIICYCRLMPRHQKSLDEAYLKEHYTIKESHAYTTQENYRVKHAEVQVQRHSRPASYAGECRRAGGAGGGGRPPAAPPPATTARPDSREHNAQYASSSMLDDMETSANAEALKTRSLPAFLRPRTRPLSADDDLNLYAKAHLSKKYKKRMRSEQAAIIALSKSRAQLLDADAVVVIDQRTQL